MKTNTHRISGKTQDYGKLKANILSDCIFKRIIQTIKSEEAKAPNTTEQKFCSECGFRRLFAVFAERKESI